MTDFKHLQTVMESMAASLSQPATLAETRRRIIYAARDTIDGSDYASLTVLHRDTGLLETPAFTDELAWRVDQVQYEFKEGPCYDAVVEDNQVVVEDLVHDRRWPRFGPRAVEMGLRSQLALRLRDDRSIVGLNLYAGKPHAFDGSLDEVRLVASHAKVVLGYARENQQLRDGLETRTMIGEAIGILMERYRIDERRAYEFLVRVSQDTNTKLRVVAERLVHPREQQAAPKD